MIEKEDVSKALQQVPYPGYTTDIVSFGIVKDIRIIHSEVVVTLDLRTADQTLIKELIMNIEKKVKVVPGVQTVSVHVLESKTAFAAASNPSPVDAFLPTVKHKIAVASGKGGVGKSTVSVNLAVALAQRGVKVGLLDADIYGPSIPLMFGIKDRPQFDGQKLLPIRKYGVHLMSLGFLLSDDNPVIWRGPLVMRALQQLMRDVSWGDLDVMLFDMPPGTGDAQLTLSQSIALDGAVIVTTPQDVALLDAAKGVQMFRKVNVPIIGIVENMSYFLCPHCQQRTEIFSTGGARRECERLQVDLLGEIPLDVDIRIGGDEGNPVVQKNPDHAQARVFSELAQKIVQHLNKND
jgi:ATP-binding protein involved in chromosome partitioning